VKHQYQCIGKFGMFKFLNQKGCGEKWDRDFDKCPLCRGYLIPESMVTEVHLDNIIDRT
jgi:hypothetical protein